MPMRKVDITMFSGTATADVDFDFGHGWDMKRSLR